MQVTQRADWGVSELTDGTVDCVWISFAGRRDAGPLRTRLIQWVDWKMQGTLSRFVLDELYRGEDTTFLPTLKRLPVSFLALAPSGAMKWEQFVKNCEGLKLTRVALVFEDPDKISDWEKASKAHRDSIHPERLFLVPDQPI